MKKSIDLRDVISEIKDLKPYVPGKPISETQREYGLKKVIKLASNENPFGPSHKAIKAVQKVLRESHLYPDAAAFELKQNLKKALGVSAEEICIGNGSNEVIEFLIRTLCTRGDQIVTSQGAFIAYEISAQIHGVKTIKTPLKTGFQFDLDAMLDCVAKTPNVKVVFIPNPNNPSGILIPHSEIKKFIKKVDEICTNRQMLVVIDSAYQEYVDDPHYKDPLELYQEFPNRVVILRTFSKIYGLAGLRLGYGIGHPELMGLLQRVRMPFNSNHFALAAGVAALKDTAFVKKAKKANLKGLKVWENALTQIKVPFFKSVGNFILIDVKKGFDLTGPQVQELSLKQGLIFRPIGNYGFVDFLRVSIGSDSENKAAIRFFQKLKKNKLG